MIESTLLRQIREANKSFLSGSPRFLDASGEPFVVVACIDPRLTGLLEPALGLPKHRAVIIRSAGNQISERTRDEVRSIAVGLYVKNAREILIVGHTDCGMANFSAADAAEAFRKAGIPRTAFGNDDLRIWFGAFGSIRDNVVGSVEFLRRSGLVPNDVKIHGLILDTEKGSLEVVVDGDLAPASPTLAVAVLETDAVATPGERSEDKKPELAVIPSAAPVLPPAPQEKAEPAARKGPIVVGTPVAKTEPAVPPPTSLLDAALVLRDFMNRERQDQNLQRAILELRTLWKQERNPYRVFTELQKLAHAYETRYPRLPGALLYLENAIRSGHADKIGFGEIMKRILD